MIPKTIHYCWFGGKPLPLSAQKCIESWKTHCPDYEIVKWNEDNCDLALNDYVKEAFAAEKWPFVSDVMRLWILLENGGFYFDTDVEVIKNLDNLLRYDSFFGFEDTKFINTGLGFGAVKGSALIKAVLEDYNGAKFTKGDGGYDMTPCPHRNTRVLADVGFKLNGQTQQIGGDIVFAPEYLSPFSFKTGKLNVTENTYSIHNYDSTWMPEDERDSRKEYYAYVKKYGYGMGKSLYMLKKYKPAELLRLTAARIKRSLNE